MKLSQNPTSPIMLSKQARYGEIQWKDVTIQDLLEKDDFGNTLLHNIIRLAPYCDPWNTNQKTTESEKFLKESQFGKIPKHLLCHETLKQETSKGESVYLYLARVNGIRHINPNLLTKNVLLQSPPNGESLLFEIIIRKNLDLIDRKLIAEGILLEEFEPMSTTYLHICAMMGETKKIPSNLWNGDLKIRDRNNNNLLHWAADGLFENIPINNETKELILEQNNQGETPLHKAIELNQIDKEFLTPKALSIKDSNDRTPLYWLAYRNPRGFVNLWANRKDLNENLLVLKTKRKESPLHHIFNYFNPKESSQTQPTKEDKQAFRKFLSKLSNKTLTTFSKMEIETNHIGLIQKEILKKKVLQKINKNQKTLEPY